MTDLPDKVTRTMVKMRYLPSKGMARDVDGMISIRTKKKKINDSRMEMDKVTWKHKIVA